MGKYRDGTDLILSVCGNALGHSTECKISYKAETGTRKTKEAAAGKWDEKYVKSLGCTVTASGFVHEDDSANGIDGGQFIITALDHEGKAGDDETYSITLENSGAVTTVSNS